jgi:prevent-host-death family protein
MHSIKISEFKAGCIGLLNKLRRRGAKPFIVTSRGEPIAVIYPYSTEEKKRRLGAQSGKVKILGDIIDSDLASDWEALSS